MAEPLTEERDWKVWAVWLLRLGVGLFFAYTGIVKIWDFKSHDWATQAFAQNVLNFHLVSWTDSILTAVYLPWLELAAGLALALGKLQAGALTILGALSLFFLGAVASAWARGLDISCGCFGKANNATNFPEHIAFVSLILGAIVVVAWQSGQLHANKQPPVSGL
ncbi:MAG TPA: MauE/DoxX family redox-associated membrane protein [Chthoniobacteraceae bacterium]|jgi:uncharacterized membrane protein YphA (DoxX/SURF4 family)